VTSQFKHRALWWQYPSLTDVPVGPWSGHLPHTNENVIQHWKLAIDWMADLGMNVFIGSLVSYMKSAGQPQLRDWRCYMSDWPFHMVCKWEKYPHAQVYSDRFLEETRKQVNILLDYFRKKGIRPYLQHYNYFAPYEWWKRQPDLVNKQTRPEDAALFPVPGYNPVQLSKNICPNEPLYQKFMQDSWRELFQRLPGLEGLLITLGENRRCPCFKCTGGESCYNSTAGLKTHVKYTEMYKATLKAMNKDPMVRAWHGGGDEASARAMPKGMTYIIKYSGFNSIDCGPDLIHRFWRDEGHRLWVVHEVAGSESGGPFTWVNPDWVYQVNERAQKEMKIEGAVAFHNEYMARLGHTYPGMTVNMEAALRAFNGEAYNEKQWEKRCAERLGPNGAIYLKAGKLYSQIALNIDKVVSGLTDGVAFCFNYYFTEPAGFPGVVGDASTEPHVWTRGNVAILRQYEEYLKDNPWQEDILTKAIKPGQIDPVSFLKEKWDEAKKGLALVEKLKIGQDDPTHTTHQVMLLSARCAVETARYWHAMVWGKILYYGFRSSCTPFARKVNLAKQCLQMLDEAVAAIWEMTGLYRQFPARYFDWGKGLNSENTIEKKLAHCRKERDKVAAELAPLLEGKIIGLCEFKYWPEK